jgi:hypothetical protein
MLQVEKKCAAGQGLEPGTLRIYEYVAINTELSGRLNIFFLV